MASRPGQTGSFLFYAAVLLVAASSVAFGLDWMQAPLPPMPETEASVQAAKLAAHVPPPRKLVVAKAAPRSVYPAQSAPQQPPNGSRKTAAVEPAPQNPQQAAGAPAIMTPEQAAAPAATSQPKCDVAACSAAYRSFRASDCTWQPYDGPRRLCDKGQPQQEATLEQGAAQPTQVSDKCDIEACKRAYFTFDPTDCTYQPSNGPRRLCTRGTPPKPVTAAAPAGQQPQQQAAAPVSNKCDIEACKRAYVTFNPADCTYKPTLYGPRELCTKGTPPREAAAPANAPAPSPPPSPPPAAPTPAAAANAANPPPPTATPAGAAAPQGEQAKQEAPAAAPAPAATTPPAAPAPPPNGEPVQQEAAAPATTSPPAAPATPPAAAAPAAAAPVVSDKCDVEACKRAYHTFNPADCTYKPTLYGPRELCTKGTPPKPQATAAPIAPPAAAATPAGEQANQEAPAGASAPATATSPVAGPPAAAPVVSDKCDVEACKRAFFTFNPADCTYQPANGPRRLCTKRAPAASQAAAPPTRAPRRIAPNRFLPPGLVPSGH